MIEMKRISKKFGDKQVLKNITLEAGAGEIVGLLGPSGAGKTTIIKILTGQLKQDEGSAFVLGDDNLHFQKNTLEKLGIMMDNFGIYDRLSVWENMKFYAEIYGAGREDIEAALSAVDMLDSKKTKAMNLSKGMKNRLSLARAIMNHKKILFLDEPTSGLDPASALEIHKLIGNLKNDGCCVFLTTHNMEEATKLCDRVNILYDGEIIEAGKVTDICTRHQVKKAFRIVTKDDDEILLPYEKNSAAVIGEMLEKQNIKSVHTTEPTLEKVFLQLTGHDFEEADNE